MEVAFARANSTRGATLICSLLMCSAQCDARAEDAGSTQFPFALDGAYHEIDSKYIFGFTDGSDIGSEGEKDIESQTDAAFRKRRGDYTAVEQEFELEHVPTQFFAYELSLHGTAHSIQGVDGCDDRHRVGASGFSANLRYLLIGRGPGESIGLTVTAEPEWARIDGDSGQNTRSFGSTFKLLADTELIENRLFAAANLSYQPGFAKAVADPAWQRSSTFGITGALAWRVSPTVTLGGEIEHYRAFDSLGFGAFQGNALYLGPSLHVQITKKIMLASAFSVQVAGHAVSDVQPLDLTNFTRYRARLKLEYEF